MLPADQRAHPRPQGPNRLQVIIPEPRLEKEDDAGIDSGSMQYTSVPPSAHHNPAEDHLVFTFPAPRHSAQEGGLPLHAL